MSACVPFCHDQGTPTDLEMVYIQCSRKKIVQMGFFFTCNGGLFDLIQTHIDKIEVFKKKKAL